MNKPEREQVVLETLGNLNTIYKESGGTAILSSVTSDSSNPEEVYVDLISRLLALLE